MSENVAKFGGTSMAQPAVVAELLAGQPEHWPYVVVSAPGSDPSYKTKITDHLITLSGLDGDSDAWNQQATAVIDRFDDIYRPYLGTRTGSLNDRFRELLVRNRYRQRVMPALGEAASAYYFSELIDGKAYVPMLDDSVDITDFPIQLDNAGNVDYRRSIAATKKLPHTGQPLAIPGFFGFDPMGNIYPLNRGGSDRTGGIVSSSLDLPYDNFTDVEGIFAADPRIIDNPRHMPFLSYRETREAAVGGSGVLEGNTIADMMTISKLAGKKGVPIYVRDTFHPDGNFTTISPHVPWRQGRRRGVQLISARVLTSLTVYDPSSADMSGWIANLTGSMRSSVNIEHTITGRDGITFLVDADSKAVGKAIESMRAVGSLIANISWPVPRTVVTVVGEDISNGDHYRFVNRATAALRAAKVKIVTTPHHHPDSPSIVVTTGIRDVVNGKPDVNRRAVKALYDAFLADKNQPRKATV